MGNKFLHIQYERTDMLACLYFPYLKHRERRECKKTHNPIFGQPVYQLYRCQLNELQHVMSMDIVTTTEGDCQ